MDISAVRSALATAASAASGTTGLTCHGYVPDSVVEPCFFVGGYRVDFDQAAARGSDRITFACRLLVSRSDDVSGQSVMDALLAGSGAGSLKAAIEADQTLGGLVDWLHVTGVDASDLVVHAGTTYYGAEITVEVDGDGA